MLVLGLIGKRACGKNLFADHLKRKYRFKTLDYTRHVLSPILRKRGKPVTRKNLTSLAMKLRRRYGEDVLTKRLCRRIRKGNYVISGIRFPAEVKCLRGGFSEDFKLIALRANAKFRHSRARRRGLKGEKSLTFKEFLKLEKLPTESVIPRTMESADFVIANNSTARDFYKKIDNLMRKLGVKI